MVASIEGAVRAAQTKQADERAGQGALFGGGPVEEDAAPVHLERAAPWSEAEALAFEKDTLGFYVSSHPLEEWRHWASIFTTARLGDMKALKQDQRVVVAAMVQSARTTVTRNGRYAGEKMAIITIEDDAGVCDAVLFAEVYAKHGHLLESDKPIFVLGRIDHSRGDAQIMVDRLAPIDGAPLHGGRLRLTLHESRLNGGASQRLTDLRQIVATHEESAPDTTPLDIAVCAGGVWATLRPDTDIRVRLGPALAREASSILGERCLRLVGGMSVENLRQNGQRYGRKGEKAGANA
jgi:DNA polymerase-3 subunit alpha